jgi:uncharacterized protein YggE
VLSISEYSSGGTPVPYMNSAGAADAKAASVPINAGQTEVVLSVSVSWVLN